MNYRLILFFSLLVLVSCSKETDAEIEDTENTGNPSILNQLANNYDQLPEKEIAISLDKRVYAQYAKPTEKYSHGILGDRVEAEQLVVVVDSVFYEFKLATEYVFEDIRPRLYDVDGDGELEFITIRTNVSKGAGIAIYKIVGGQLLEYTNLPEIGTSNRWLNIVAVNDLDYDGTVELVWIQTPHIGGILKVAKIEAGELKVITEKSKFSNHAIGERNLCLSVLTEQSGEKVFYVPNQSRNKIVGFTFKNNVLQVVDEIDQTIDFSLTLDSQYNFSNTIDDENNCINAN